MMDERTQQAVETTLTHELIYNERIVQHPRFGAVRLRRPTPEQERLIAEARRKQYHADLKDESILSRDEIEAIAIRRGMWSPELSKKITELTQRVGEAMAILDAIGFKSLDGLLDAFNNAVSDLLKEFEDEEIRAAIRRYFSFDKEEAGKSEDKLKILKAATSSRVDELMEEAENLRAQIRLLENMFEVRKELAELQARQARLFMDSIEARADRAEELARVYYCCTDAATGKHLWPTLDDLWKAPAEDVEFLLLEYHYFANGITEEFREAMEKYGFIRRLTGTKPSSADSPDQPQSNSDGESVGSEPTDSSPAME